MCDISYDGDSIEPEEYEFGRWVAERDIAKGREHESKVYPGYWDGTGEHVAAEAYKRGYNDVWNAHTRGE